MSAEFIPFEIALVRDSLGGDGDTYRAFTRLIFAAVVGISRARWACIEKSDASIEDAGAVIRQHGPGASLQNEAPRVLKRSRPGNGRHKATNSELLLHRS